MVGKIRNQGAAFQLVLPGSSQGCFSKQHRGERSAGSRSGASHSARRECRIGFQGTGGHYQVRDCVGARAYAYDIRGAGAKSPGFEADDHAPRASVACGWIDRGNTSGRIYETVTESRHSSGFVYGSRGALLRVDWRLGPGYDPEASNQLAQQAPLGRSGPSRTQKETFKPFRRTVSLSN